MKWAIFGLLLLPFAEIAVFVAVGLKIGFLAALALMILTTMAGSWVIRHAGRREIERVRTAFGDRVITRTELDGPGFLTVLGGILLVVPGFITDVLGLLLLLPVTRRLLARLLQRAAGAPPPQRPGVVDLPPGEWRHVPDERVVRRPNSPQN